MFSSIQTGRTPDKNRQSFYYSHFGIPWIKLNNLSFANPISKTDEYLTALGCGNARVFPPNTVYVCCIGTLGKVGYSNTECSCNQQINALIFNEHMIWKYGYYLTISQINQYDLLGTGNVLRIINSASQGKAQCCVPPIIAQEKNSTIP